MASLVNNTATNANTTPITDWSSLLGAGIGAGVSLLGNNSATNALTSAENNAINTQTGVQQQLAGIYSGQRALGTGADASLSSQLGLGGTPDYSAFNNSPGFQFALTQGDQAINRNASANGSLYTPNTMASLSNYNTGYASQNYNNYISQLLQSAGLGAQGNSGLASGITSTGANISQLQQNQGNANAGGAANTSGIVGNLLSKLPYGSILGSGSANGSGITGQYAAGTAQYAGGLDQSLSDQIGQNAAGWGPDLSSLGDTSSINWGDDSGP